MALSANLTIREGALLPEIGRQRVREEGGAFDPELELSRIRNSDTSAQPLDPFGARPPASEVLSDDYEAAIRGSLPTGGTYRAGLSTRNLRGTFNSFADDYYSFLGVSLTQPLLRNAGTSPALAALRFARTEREAYEWSYRQVIHDIVTWTALAYFDLVRARDALRVAERSVELGEQLVRDNQRRHERGAMSTQDVVEAQARAARRRDVLLDARLMSSAAENRLKRFLYADFASMERIQIEPLRVPLDPPTEADVAAALAGALEARPDYQLASLEVDQRRIDHSLARSRALPAVDLVASYGYNGNDASFSDSFSHIRERESEAYSIGAIVTVPLPNRSRSASRRIAELDVKRAELALEDFAQEVWRQLADARRALEVTRERVDASRHARDLASRSLEAEEKRLRAGTSTTFLVLEQQESLAEMELREARAEADLASAVAEFHRLTGRTLEAFQLDPALVPTGLQ
jgi:outer membrane protein TolC